MLTKDAGKEHEIIDRVLVCAPGAAVGDVGKPLELWGHFGEALKLGGGQQPFCRCDFGWELRDVVVDCVGSISRTRLLAGSRVRAERV